MGYVVARKHSLKLRRMAVLLGLLVPLFGLVLTYAVAAYAATFIMLVTVISGFTGILIERWLFFAEARHAVTLFYGRSL
jgi:DMSO reductase anchor subunit